MTKSWQQIQHHVDAFLQRSGGKIAVEFSYRPSYESFTRDISILMIQAKKIIIINCKNEGLAHSGVCLSKKIIHSEAVKVKQQVEAHWLIFFFLCLNI